MRGTVIAVSLALAGCMPSTLPELQREGLHDSFTTESPYQQAYRNILRMVRECSVKGILMAKSDIDGQLYPDLRTGEIRFAYNNMGDQSVLLYSEIKAADEGTTVSTYVPDAGVHPSMLPSIRAWADGREMTCPTTE